MAKVKCPRCFHVNPEGKDSCEQCNTVLPRIKIEAGPTRQEQPSAAPLRDAAPQQPPDAQLRRGQVLASRYTVLNLVGRGGMGCIYKVHDNVLGEDLALKTLLPQFVRDKNIVERFLNEARIARKMAHPNVVRVHDIGNANGVVYISMEFLEGRSLRNVLDSLPPGQRMPLRDVLNIFDQLCASLEYAHQFTVHRDIKPENVMLCGDGTVKLMDFGISKLMANTRLTNASIVMGTPFYMSPEQLRNSRDVDARADIYSVGVMLYEVLTGNMPTGVPKPASELVRGIPAELDHIVKRCVEPDPKDRYQDAIELRTDLIPMRQAIMSGDMSMLKTVHRFTGNERRFPWRKVAGVIVLALATAGLVAGGIQVEAKRKALVEAAAAATLPAQNFSGNTSAAAIESLINELQEKIQKRAQSSTTVTAILNEAQNRQALALDASKRLDTKAGDMLIEALRCFAAAAVWQEGQVFIPAGNVVIDGINEYVPSFLIDSKEVTVGDFADLSQIHQGWRYPPELAGANYTLPVTWVSYFDAQAYAASKGKLLPSYSQWARAAYGYPANASPMFPWGDSWTPGMANANNEYGASAAPKSYESDKSMAGCYDMAGNVSEWTRTPRLGAMGLTDDGMPSFGSEIFVCGGNYAEPAIPLMQPRYMLFESRSPYLGFRCVQELPTKPDEVRKVLDALPAT